MFGGLRRTEFIIQQYYLKTRDGGPPSPARQN
jgi:hypothetical protein